MTTKTAGRFQDLAKQFDRSRFAKLNQIMGFSDYLDLVFNNPKLAYSAYQRLYNMIVSAGTYELQRYRKTITKYKFFNDPEIPIFGLEDTLEGLVKHIKGAADWYGTEKRILLLHGPVGSSKSTICRLLKKGMERYSQTDDGAIYTYTWKDIKEHDIQNESPCPLNDDPLKLIPLDMRTEVCDRLNTILEENTPPEQKHLVHRIKVTGELNPHCKFFMGKLLKQYEGDWGKVVANHIQVRRIVLSEADRIGIGTFQPKDPKNQDATELTGDINYMKLGRYGVDSDPRAFSFDGEFEVANRGLLEFIEVLKLEKEFLYDLLGVCQERQFKPKKFPQIDVDMVLLGHSVHGSTPIPHEYKGVLDVLPINAMANLDVSKLRVFSVNEETKEVELTEVNSVFSHDFKGEWIVNEQNDEMVTTTPNHSVYNEQYETFYPGDDDTTNILQVEIPQALVEGKKVTKRWEKFFSQVLQLA
jgi:serine protein kinase